MELAFFITTKYILKYYQGYIEPNMDANSLSSFIGVAQDIRIQSVLGYDLYNRYLNDINTYNAPQGVNYQYLMDNFIQKSLAIWTLYEALDSLDTKITNKGIVTKTSDNSETASDKRIEKKLNRLSNSAQFYDTRIREYIMNNPSEFPEYFTQNGVMRIKARTDNYFAGMWLPELPFGTNGGTNIAQYNRCCDGNQLYIN